MVRAMLEDVRALPVDLDDRRHVEVADRPRPQRLYAAPRAQVAEDPGSIRSPSSSLQIRQQKCGAPTATTPDFLTRQERQCGRMRTLPLHY
jgi:hypothetical protein